MKVILFLLAAIVAPVLSNSDLCKLNLYSPPGTIHYSYFPFLNNKVEFLIRSHGGVRLLLSNDYAPNLSRNYELVIGSDGIYNIRLYRDSNLIVSKDVHIFDPKDFRRFELTTYNGQITLTTNIDHVMIAHKEQIFVPLKIIGIAANSNVNAELLYECNQFARTCK